MPAAPCPIAVLSVAGPNDLAEAAEPAARRPFRTPGNHHGR